MHTWLEKERRRAAEENAFGQGRRKEQGKLSCGKCQLHLYMLLSPKIWVWCSTLCLGQEQLQTEMLHLSVCVLQPLDAVEYLW